MEKKIATANKANVWKPKYFFWWVYGKWTGRHMENTKGANSEYGVTSSKDYHIRIEITYLAAVAARPPTISRAWLAWSCKAYGPHTDFAVDRSQRSTRGAGCIWAGATGPRKLFRLEFHILFSFYFFMCSIFVFNFFMFYFLSSTFLLFLLFFLMFCVENFSLNFLLRIFCWTFLAPKFLLVQKFCIMTFISKIHWSQNIPVQSLRNLSV